MINDKLQLFCKMMISRNYKETTIENYHNALLQFNKWNSSNTPLSKELLFRYIEQIRASGKSYSYIRIAILAIGLYSELILGESIKHDFLNGFRRHVKLPEVLTLDEVKCLLESFTNLKHKTIMSMIYSCGLSVSECINLKISDINSQNMTVRIDQGEANKVRFVPLSPKILILLNEYKNVYVPDKYLFEGQTEEKYSKRSIQAVLKAALKKCNITKKITVHSLRHSFATHLVEQGIDMHVLQDLLGHKDIRTTQIYSYIVSVNLNKITNPYDRIL
jgi:site-specific recombinase XerD